MVRGRGNMECARLVAALVCGEAAPAELLAMADV